MKIKEIYSQFRLLIEKNATNNKLNVDTGRFILLFNLTTKRFQNYILEKRNDDSIRMLSPFLVLNKTLTESEKTETYATYAKPKDYFEFSNVTVRATKKNCVDKILLSHEIKSENVHQYLFDEFTKPSFLARETLYLMTEDGVTVYKDLDFDITKVELSYYKEIPEADIAGYKKMDGTQSQDIDTTIPENAIPIITMAMVKLFSMSSGDTQTYQIANAELFGI